jgi:hypothetical protein
MIIKTFAGAVYALKYYASAIISTLCNVFLTYIYILIIKFFFSQMQRRENNVQSFERLRMVSTAIYFDNNKVCAVILHLKYKYIHDCVKSIAKKDSISYYFVLSIKSSHA